MELSELQKRAAQRTGQDVCVVAGPGSGKTRVLVERFCWLVGERRCSPARILAITFTEKAATEIKQRLVEKFGASAGLRQDIEKAYVSTIHGFCARLLRENPVAAGLDPEFVVLDEAPARAELEQAAETALEDLHGENPGAFRELLEALHVSTRHGSRSPDLAAALLQVYDAMRTVGAPIDGLKRQPAPASGAAWTGLLDQVGDALTRMPAGSSAKQRQRAQEMDDWIRLASTVSPSPASKRHFELIGGFPGSLAGMGRTAFASLFKPIREQIIPQVLGVLIEEYYAGLRELVVAAVERTDGVYRGRKRELGALDFSDLEERAIALLRAEPSVRDSVRDNFDHILMDELQDTNPLQWRLLDLIRSPGRFFAVGDVNQSIYGFRHADPGVFLQYRKGIEERGQAVDELFENHRSRKEILDAVSVVVEELPGIEPHTLRAARPFHVRKEPSVEVLVGLGDTSEDAGRDEARQIARRILELVDKLPLDVKDGGQRPARFRDIAVLARSMNALNPVREALQEFDVPHLVTGGKAFYEAREVLDLVLLLRVIANPLDEIALAGVLRSPLVGVSDETVLRLCRDGTLGRAFDALDRLDLAGFDEAARERLLHFHARLAAVRARRDDIPPDRLLARIIDDCGYEIVLPARARANAGKLLGLLRGRYGSGPRSIHAVVEDLDWLRAAQAEPDAPPGDPSDAVRVMNIHQAKGLQFPVVFLCGMGRGTDRQEPVICLAPDGGLGVSWANPFTRRGQGDSAHARSTAARKQQEQREENRLLYVAMTRAEEHLVLSYARTNHASNWAKIVEERLRVEPRPASKSPEPLPRSAVREPEEPEVFPLDAPVLRDQHDATASVTDVRLFESCPRRYYLARYLGWRGGRGAAPPPAGAEAEEPFEREEPDSLDAAEFGQAVHALLAGNPVPSAPQAAVELAARFRESDLGMRAARADRAGREQDFVMAIDDVVLRGQIDLWYEEGGELVVVDYKTDEVDPPAAPQHGRSYALQLRLYALALERIAGRLPDRAFVYLLRPDLAVEIDLDSASLTRVRETVVAFRNAQSALAFGLREGEHCFRCPFYRGLCPAGS